MQQQEPGRAAWTGGVVWRGGCGPGAQAEPRAVLPQDHSREGYSAQGPEVRRGKLVKTLCNFQNLVVFLRFFFFFFNSFMRDTERERVRQGEKQAPCREPHVGLDLGTPGSHPGLKAVLNC